MSATKLPQIIGLLGKLEASYNAGGALSTATDGILLAAPTVPDFQFAHDGSRTPPPGMAGYQRRVKPSGKGGTLPVSHEAKGPGTAYSASNLPTNHVLQRISGFDSVVDVSVGTEKVTYTPTPGGAGSGFASGVFSAYARQQLFPIQGVYANLERISAEGPVVPLWEYMLYGLFGAVSDAAVPAITYPYLTVDPPKFVNIAFTLGTFVNGVVRKFSLSMNRAIGMRANQNAAGGHAGYSPSGRRTPTIEATIEATALQASPYHAASAIDPYQLYENGTELDFSIQWGAQYNRWKIQPGKVQIMSKPTEDEDEGGALWTLQLQCNPTSINSNDDVSIIAN